MSCDNDASCSAIKFPDLHDYRSKYKLCKGKFIHSEWGSLYAKTEKNKVKCSTAQILNINFCNNNNNSYTHMRIIIRHENSAFVLYDL